MKTKKDVVPIPDSTDQNKGLTRHINPLEKDQLIPYQPLGK